jgi:hypothetical protein
MLLIDLRIELVRLELVRQDHWHPVMHPHHELERPLCRRQV